MGHLMIDLSTRSGLVAVIFALMILCSIQWVWVFYLFLSPPAVHRCSTGCIHVGADVLVMRVPLQGNTMRSFLDAEEFDALSAQVQRPGRVLPQIVEVIQRPRLIILP